VAFVPDARLWVATAMRISLVVRSDHGES
jgi:hypothetical protein